MGEKRKESKANELMYVDIMLNGKSTCAMLDTGATHNFVSDREARRLGLKLEKDPSRMKAVNSVARPIAGQAKGVSIKLGSWEGKTNLMAVPLDDFHVILGMEFLQNAQAIPMPFLNAVCITGGASPCIVPATQKALGKNVELISALQLKRGLKKGEQTFVAAMSLEDMVVSNNSLPHGVAEVLKEFGDTMPPELPKTLPPKRVVDHMIELEPGAKPPARSPYRMAPPELAELRS